GRRGAARCDPGSTPTARHGQAPRAHPHRGRQGQPGVSLRCGAGRDRAPRAQGRVPMTKAMRYEEINRHDEDAADQFAPRAPAEGVDQRTLPATLAAAVAMTPRTWPERYQLLALAADAIDDRVLAAYWRARI